MTAAVSSTEALTVTAPAPKSHLWDGSSFGFTDILGIINPLQHIPIVATIYRAVTGDTIGNVARVVGDGLFGGLLGVASGAVDVATSEATGKDIGQHVLDTLEDMFSSSKPEEKPTPAQPAAPQDPLMAAAGAQPDALKLPQLGSASTASALAAAAPISPLEAPKLAAEAQAQAAPSGAIRPLKPLVSPGQPIPIDVSARGIAMMRANSTMHSPRPVPLNLPAGSLPVQQSGGGGPIAPAAGSPMAGSPAAIASQADFAQRMRDGLAKYDALMAAQARAAQPSSVDQLH